jgi:uncharacterized membrane protein
MGRPAKITSEIGAPASDTLLEAQDLTPAPAPPKKSHHAAKKSTSGQISYEELQQKLTRSFNFAAFILHSKKTYQEKDFIEEAKDLNRLASKYELINVGLTLLDPLFFLFGIFGKVSEMIKDREPKKPKTEQPGAGSAPQAQQLQVINN